MAKKSNEDKVLEAINSVASSVNSIEERLTKVESGNNGTSTSTSNSTNTKTTKKKSTNNNNNSNVLNKYEENGLLFTHVQYENSEPSKGHYIKMETTGAKSPVIGESLNIRYKSIPVKAWITMLDLMLTEIEAAEIADKDTIYSEVSDGLISFIYGAYKTMLSSMNR